MPRHNIGIPVDPISKSGCTMAHAGRAGTRQAYPLRGHGNIGETGKVSDCGARSPLSPSSLFRLLLVNVSSHFSHAGSMSCQSAVGGGCPVSSWARPRRAGVKARRSQAGRVHVGAWLHIFPYLPALDILSC